MFECVKTEKGKCCILGAVAGIVATQVLKSKCFRKACVNVLAGGMKVQQDAQVMFENMKEEAQDLCFEAQQEVAAE